MSRRSFVSRSAMIGTSTIADAEPGVADLPMEPEPPAELAGADEQAPDGDMVGPWPVMIDPAAPAWEDSTAEAAPEDAQEAQEQPEAPVEASEAAQAEDEPVEAAVEAGEAGDDGMEQRVAELEAAVEELKASRHALLKTKSSLKAKLKAAEERAEAAEHQLTPAERVLLEMIAERAGTRPHAREQYFKVVLAFVEANHETILTVLAAREIIAAGNRLKDKTQPVAGPPPRPATSGPYT